MPDVATLDALVTVINAVAAGAALVIHAWGHTHPSTPKQTCELSKKQDPSPAA